MADTTNTDAVVEALVSDHLYLVQHIVHELAVRYPRHVDRQELWSAGAMGLVEAARRYQTTGDVPFAHYARRRIRGAVLDSTRGRDWATRGVRAGKRQLDTAATAFEQAHHRAATDAELAAELGIAEAEVTRRRAAAARGTVLHLDQPLAGGDGETGSLADTLATSELDASPADSVELRDLIGTVRTAVAHLEPTQRDIVERIYLHGELLRDIAASMGVTEARISQLATEAVHALRAYLTQAEYDAPAVPESAAGKRRRAAYVARVAESTTWQQRYAASTAAADAPLQAAG